MHHRTLGTLSPPFHRAQSRGVFGSEALTGVTQAQIHDTPRHQSGFAVAFVSNDPIGGGQREDGKCVSVRMFRIIHNASVGVDDAEESAVHRVCS